MMRQKDGLTQPGIDGLTNELEGSRVRTASRDQPVTIPPPAMKPFFCRTIFLSAAAEYRWWIQGKRFCW
jgi:hypothetical protein